jgi:predicted DNA-binding antitoxin AbrB/MazE fold protein
MPVVRAVYENGVFKPTQPVALPEATEVEFVPQVVSPTVQPAFISDPNPSPEEFRRILDAMAGRPGGKPLPPDFSRADIYDDHD